MPPYSRIALWLAWLVGVFLLLGPTHQAFVLSPFRTTRNCQQQQEPRGSTRLQTSRKTNSNIPVLCNILGHPPLLVGSEMTLHPPTPLQWQTIQESAFLYESKDKRKENAERMIAGAPLVAILDNDSSSFPDEHSPTGGRYATVAAIMDLSSSSSSFSNDPLWGEEPCSSLVESVVCAKRRGHSVRVVGVGRVQLDDVRYQESSCAAQQQVEEDKNSGVMQDDHEGNCDPTAPPRETLSEQPEGTAPGPESSIPPGEAVSNEQQGEDDPNEWDDDDDDTDRNIFMARYEFVNDTPKHASPVHSIQTMSLLARQVEWKHQDRRKWVADIQTGRARIAAAAAKRRCSARILQAQDGGKVDNDNDDDDEMKDYDGLGTLFGWKDADKVPQGVAVVQEKKASAKRLNRTDTTLVADPDDTKSTTCSSLSKLESFGLGSSAASFSNLQKLTTVVLDKLEPYFYNTEKFNSEEHFYEVLSFVSVSSLKETLKASDFAWSLRCTSTAERLEKVCSWMDDHLQSLRAEADRITEELKEFGEEHNDLFSVAAPVIKKQKATIDTAYFGDVTTMVTTTKRHSKKRTKATVVTAVSNGAYSAKSKKKTRNNGRLEKPKNVTIPANDKPDGVQNNDNRTHPRVKPDFMSEDKTKKRRKTASVHMVKPVDGDNGDNPAPAKRIKQKKKLNHREAAPVSIENDLRDDSEKTVENVTSGGSADAADPSNKGSTLDTSQKSRPSSAEVNHLEQDKHDEWNESGKTIRESLVELEHLVGGFEDAEKKNIRTRLDNLEVEILGRVQTDCIRRRLERLQDMI